MVESFLRVGTGKHIEEKGVGEPSGRTGSAGPASSESRVISLGLSFSLYLALFLSRYYLTRGNEGHKGAEGPEVRR